MAEDLKQLSTAGLTSLDPGKINPAEADPEQLSAYKDSLSAYKKSLEQRYAQPNWFNIAAGFAKPQLGGFLASLGSASEAMGKNVEQQREMQIPIAEMQARISQADILMGQKTKQNQIYQDWRKSGRPMDADTYSRISSLGTESEVAKAAQKFYEGAKEGLGLKIQAVTAQAKDPMMDLQGYTDFQLKPDVDPNKGKAKETAYLSSLEASKPPQIDSSQWDSMSRYDKMDTASKYAQAQRDAGMGVEEKMRQQANSAPERLTLLRSIRDLSLGTGIPDSKDAKGNSISGQQQMASALNYFGGNNPIEAIARAAADGKLTEFLRGFDTYARQIGMTEETKNKFQALSKLLAENQVSLRGASLNPTDAYSQLQQSASPNIGNSQNALVTLVDLIGHSEKHNQEKYNYVKENKIPYGQLERDPRFLKDIQSKYADEHVKIATGNPLMNAPSWYSPSAGNVSKQKESVVPAEPNAPVSAKAAKPAAKPASGTPNKEISSAAIKAEIAKRAAKAFAGG